MKMYSIDSKKVSFLIGLTLTIFLSTTQIFAQQCPNLLWSDEFSGSSLDQTKWEYMIGDGCNYGICNWGNNELQYYKSENVTLSNGIMTITAKNEKFRKFNYSSARIRTLNKGDWTYGRFEARIKLPTGQGLWPAFWMLPTNEVYGGWPQSGEIDIMELVGHEPATIHGTLHYGDAWPNNSSTGAGYTLNSGIFNDDFHTFAIEWEPNVIRWYVDDYLYSTKTSADLAPKPWPFDQDFHFLLNVAVGGNWPGSPDATTSFPQTMDVDYVRVYDGYFPYLTGDRIVPNQASGESYSIVNAEAGSSFTWTVPSGATITSGQGTNSITVDWGNSGGDVVADVIGTCQTKQYKVNVEVEAPLSYSYTFENFDDPEDITFSSSTGTLTEVANPSTSGVNTSTTTGKYDRNASEQYDVLVYDVSSITNAGDYKNGQKRFYIDVYTAAPVGSVILLQLENSSTATSSNYPAGRHSRYQGVTTTQNQWERMELTYLDSPDGSTPDNSVDDLIFLFSPNTFTGDTYYFDNFDSYSQGGGTTNNPPSVSITSPADGTQYTQLSTITIEASASDNDGSVQQVEFFVDGNSIGTDNTSPYEMNWTIPADGNYTLSATATDDDNASANSADVDISASTSSGPSYCSSSGNGNNEWISSVTIGSFTNSSGKSNYTDFTSVVASLGTGNHSVTLTPSYQGPSRDEYWRIWMDLNNDGDFDDTGELTFDAGSAQSGTITGTLSIPSSADGVNTRMRISMKRGSAPSSCGSINRGEVEDYTVDISNSARLSNIKWNFQIYPNPANDKISILFNDQEINGTISIVDPLGKVIKKGGIKHAQKIDISTLPSGLYFISVLVKDEVKTQRFVKIN